MYKLGYMLYNPSGCCVEKGLQGERTEKNKIDDEEDDDDQHLLIHFLCQELAQVRYGHSLTNPQNKVMRNVSFCFLYFTDEETKDRDFKEQQCR